MYFEVWKNGNLIKRGKKTLQPIDFDNELMFVPTFDLVLPIDWLECFDGWEDVKLFVNGKCFWGLVWDIEADKVAETITVTCRHIISEWEHRQISVNHAMSNEELNVVFKGEKVKKDEKKDESITASDFSIIGKQLKKMTDEKWIEKASAYAWVTSNGDKLPIKVDASDVEKDDGTYKVKFSTEKGTSITVECNVTKAIDYGKTKKKTNKTNRETISARPFSADPDLGLTAEDVKKKVKAQAWKYKSKPRDYVDVVSITTDFVNTPGIYYVTATTQKGTTITVYVTIETQGDHNLVSDPSVVDQLDDIYADLNFAYPGWDIDFQGDSGSRMIDYVYSKQNKLEALTQTMELTADLFWRVGWWNEKRVEIGVFGEEKPYIISKKPSGKSNIRIITEPVIDYDFETVINVATVYSDKSDSGMSSLTLREVYNNPDKQKEGFPVVILRENANNERPYEQYMAPNQPPKIAPNNELEFAVLDEESIALESGRLIEGSFPFNDLNPFETEGEDISDEKRKQAAQTVYEAAIRKLIASRRSYNIQVTTEEVPADLLPGDKVRFIYDNDIWNLDACSSYWKKILSYSDWFYVIKMEHRIDDYDIETNTLTLAKWIKVDRDTIAYV